MAKVEIYTKAFCPYCARALKLLASKGVEPIDHEISLDRGARDEMLKRAGGVTTVPQIWIGDRHVGGSDDLAALETRGELDALLAA